MRCLLSEWGRGGGRNGRLAHARTGGGGRKGLIAMRGLGRYEVRYRLHSSDKAVE